MIAFKKLTEGKQDEINWGSLMPFYANMAQDVATQKKRIGGDFVVAQAVPSRMFRDLVKTVVPDCVFVTLTLTKDAQRKRITSRGDSKGVSKLYSEKLFDLFEPVGIDEKNTYNVSVTDDMSPTEVMSKVLEVVEEN